MAIGFNSYHNSTPNPAQRFYRWSGGLKNVTMPDGTEAKQLKGELAFYNGEEMEPVDLPFSFCALEQTSSVVGYKPGMGSEVRYFSNEITSFDEVMKVSCEDGNGTRVIAEGLYSQIKTTLPEGCKFQTNLYIYNPATDVIERLNLKGSSLSAWIEFGQKNKGIYEHVVTLEGAGEKKVNGATEYLPPKFVLGAKYSDEDMKVLTEKDAIVLEYLHAKRDANMNGKGDSSVNQEPAQYEGEGSQEVPSVQPGQVVTPSNADDNNGEIALEDIPF